MGSESGAANAGALAGPPEQASPLVLPVLPAALLSSERMRTLAWCGRSLAGCAVVCVAVTAAAPGRGGAVIFLLAPLLVAAGPAIRRWRLRKPVTDGSFRELSDQAVGTAPTAALRPVWVTQVAVRRGNVAGLARSFRAGPRAVVLVHEVVLGRPDAGVAPGSGCFSRAHHLGTLAQPVHGICLRPVRSPVGWGRFSSGSNLSAGRGARPGAPLAPRQAPEPDDLPVPAMAAGISSSRWRPARQQAAATASTSQPA